jgi:hypothetical protein
VGENWLVEKARERIQRGNELVNDYVIVTLTIMKRRFVAVIIVVLAVLFCQSGGVVLAAICPHLRGAHETCHGMVAAVQSHQTQQADAFETSDSGAACNHCVIPAGNKRDDLALQEPNSAQRASDLTVSIHHATPNAPALVKTVTWVAKAHGPPRDAGSLYVLINIFRI